MIDSVMSGTAVDADMILHQITSLYSKYIKKVRISNLIQMGLHLNTYLRQVRLKPYF